MFYRDVIAKIAGIAQQIIPMSTDPEKDDDGIEISDLKQELGILKHKYWEQFNVIEKVIQQRDVWKNMYKTQALEHLAAQNIISRSLISTRMQLSKLLKITNQMLEEKNLKPIKAPGDMEPFDGSPADEPAKYVEKLQLLHSKLAVELDAIGKRDELSQGMKRPL